MMHKNSPLFHIALWHNLTLAGACLAAGLLHGADIRSLDPYRVDPLTESWRWQQMKGLEGMSLELVEATPDGRIAAVEGPNNLQLFDGLDWESVELPEEAREDWINALFITSAGRYCAVATDAIYLFNGTDWIKAAEVGHSRRTWDSIIETPDGILWISIDQGVARLNPETGDCQITTAPGIVLSLCEGPDGQSLWISTAPQGEVWEGPLDNGNLLPASAWILRKPGMGREILATNLMRASDDRIWYINNHHNRPAFVYDPKTSAWEEVNLSRLGGDNFDFSIIETPDGAIWISSRGSLHILRNGEWKVYHSPEYPLPGARSTMFLNPYGAVTIVEASGMNVQIDYGRKNGLSLTGLHYQDETGSDDLLFISIDDEVVHWPSGSDKAAFYSPKETGIENPGALIVHSSGDWILSGSTDREATVSIFNGVDWQAVSFPDTALSFGHLALLERPDGEVWLGCAQLEDEFPSYGGGIVVLKRDSEGRYSMTHLHPPDFSFRNWSLVNGPGETVYTSGSGVFQNTKSGATPVQLPEEIGLKWIDQIAVDPAGDVWCAVWALGVYRFRDGEWYLFTKADGLESTLTSFIICLQNGDPVVTTREGHFRFDGQRWAPFMESLQGLHRGSGRLLEGKDGSIWINQTHVDWYYRGQRTEAYSEDKKKVFQTIQYYPDQDPPETLWLNTPPELKRNTNLRFEWKGADSWARTPSDKLQFSYRIDKGPWSPFSSSTEAFIEKMEGDKHSIEVRARDTDFNVDPSPLRSEFTVILPLWQQAWFVASLIASLIFLVAVVVVFVRQRVKHLLEIEQVKMRFFTHLSHEIKTPLSLILGPVERLQNEISDSRHQHYLSLIKSSSQRLLFLINQLLDFRKFQLNKLEFKPQEGDFIPFVKSCLAVFEGWVREKGHSLELETELTEFTFHFDQDVFHKIIDNLVNNAVKYTAPDGKISVRVTRAEAEDGTFLGQIEVEDNGPGIPAGEQEAIFEPFYRGSSPNQIEEGSGIGLAFVKDLVNAIEGTIEVRSPVHPADKERPGSCFIITFPITLKEGTGSEFQPAIEQTPEKDSSTSKKEESRNIILLIEDNRDLREFLSGELREAFKIETATNADEGILKARELIPDIVISDVVMPGKSGFEACRIIKKDAHTSHIPVILLTALRSEEHKLQAYENGADDFITKPVSPEILRLKIRNLLATQQQAREQVREKFVVDHRLTGLPEEDQAFLDKAEAMVDEHLSDEQFDVNVLAEGMGFSRSAFYRKFNSLTDLSPAAFIRSKRLRKAALWLAEGGKTVSDIAYDVGFSDAGYFSRVFKDEYKCSPSEFARKKSE